MAHLSTQLPTSVEIGAVRTDNQDGLEVVTTDGGKEVRNSRVEAEPRYWEVAMPPVSISGDMSDYDAVKQLWTDSERGLHTFNWFCFVDNEMCKVRFASARSITAAAGHLRHIDTFTLKEVIGE
jgi:hypothetical protein